MSIDSDLLRKEIQWKIDILKSELSSLDQSIDSLRDALVAEEESKVPRKDSYGRSYWTYP